MIKQMLKSTRLALRRDAELVFGYPTPWFDAKANEQYWEVRRANGMGGLNAFQRDRAELILAATAGEGVLLDIGSGDGAMLDYMRERSQLRIIASDISPKAREHLIARGYEIADLELDDPSPVADLAPLDYIALCEVLEHLPNPENVLREVRGLCRKAVFFSVPNTGYYAYRLRLLLGRFPVQWRAHPGEHLRFWTLRDMRWWINALNMSTDATVHTYQAVPVLGRFFPNLFCRGLFVEVRSTWR